MPDLSHCVRAAIERQQRIARAAEQIATAGERRRTPLYAVFQDAAI